MTLDEKIQFDRSLLGVEHHIGTFQVTDEMIVAFAQSTGETGPPFAREGKAAEGLVAPPTFCAVFVSDTTRPDIGLGFGNASLLAGQAIECLAPIRSGDTLKGTTKLDEVYAKTGRSGKMVFAVWQTRFTNQRGETVTTLRESFVRTTGADSGT